MQAYTVEQVAEMLHVGRDKVYYLLRTRQLRSIKIGKLRRITDRHLAEFVASLEEASARDARFEDLRLARALAW
jgi:excisionase family DNA binding protein